MFTDTMCIVKVFGPPLPIHTFVLCFLHSHYLSNLHARPECRLLFGSLCKPLSTEATVCLSVPCQRLLWFLMVTVNSVKHSELIFFFFFFWKPLARTRDPGEFEIANCNFTICSLIELHLYSRILSAVRVTFIQSSNSFMNHHLSAFHSHFITAVP